MRARVGSDISSYLVAITTCHTLIMGKHKHRHCPLCHTELEETDVAPCMECGHLAQEIEDALAGRHAYAEMRIFGELSLVLCNFCQVDFGAFDPEFFGLPRNDRIGYQKMQFVHAVAEVFIGRDKYCPQCNLRLSFLKFVVAAREFHRESHRP